MQVNKEIELLKNSGVYTAKNTTPERNAKNNLPNTATIYPLISPFLELENIPDKPNAPNANI